jgi:hypothetical protein
MPRFTALPHKVWKHSSGRTASIHGSVPYTSEADRPNWRTVEAGFTVYDEHFGTYGCGRQPFATLADAKAFCDRHNSK